MHTTYASAADGFFGLTQEGHSPSQCPVEESPMPGRGP